MTESKQVSDYASHKRAIPEPAGKCLLLSVVGIALILFVAMELKARQDNYPVSYPWQADMWVAQWYKLDSLPADHTVVLGASRMQHGLIIKEWEKLTGIKPLLLAWPGSLPGPVLTELAKRESFRGTVLCGIAPACSFPNEHAPWRQRILNNIRTAKANQYSLSYHLSIATLYFLRPRFKCLNAWNYSPVEILYRTFPIPNHKDLLTPSIFPFWATRDGDIQMRFTDKFESSTEQKEHMARIQATAHKNIRHYRPGNMDQMVEQYKEDVSTIESRGGKVIFIRPPSNGKYRQLERIDYPRQKFFDRLPQETGCIGIHFEDYLELRDFVCVEESHLSKSDAQEYTRRIVGILRREGVID